MKYDLVQSQFNKQIYIVLSVNPTKDKNDNPTEIYELENVRTGDIITRYKQQIDDAFDILPDELIANYVSSLKKEKWKML